ncbi:MAG: heat-inducible transcriptional repressor HrcA [Eubacteriales bacterium]|nr:heat-inducible transcriptional repressor HrcA [Eubacteriales bacterium]MDD4717341.1 heat-inducible transcriptional repressor HrcA [Eubacteriales bacterium]
MALDERKKLILKAVVDDYISTAEPVGSKALALRSDFNISSATIRNEMAELENDGYLIHPHTSAGRIPTDKGYRVYVDNLMQIPEPDEQYTLKVKEFFAEGLDEITDVLENASKALSESTGYTSLTLTPRLRKNQLKQIKMLMIEPGKVLMVVVLEEGVVKDRLVRVSDLIDESQLLRIADAVERGLSGIPIEEITFIAVAAAGKKVEIPESLLKQILYEAYVSIKQADSLGVYMDGANKMLGYPEFYEVDKAKSFMDTLSERGMVAGYLDEVNSDLESDDNAEVTRKPYMIRIGQEISITGLKDCSFVTTLYSTGGKIAGSIGVIGPRRMDYAKVVSSIGFVRSHINEELRKLCSDGCDKYIGESLK